MLRDHELPLVRVAILKGKPLRVRTVTQYDWILSIRDRPEDIGVQNKAVVHLDRHVPIDAHAVPYFRLLLHHILCFGPLAGIIRRDATIKRRALRSEGNRPVPWSGLQTELVGERLEKIQAHGQAPQLSLKLFASVPSLLQAHPLSTVCPRKREYSGPAACIKTPIAS